MVHHCPYRSAVLSMLLLFTAFGCRSADTAPPSPPAPPAPAVQAAPPTPGEMAAMAEARGLSKAFTAITRQVSPAVVYIEVSKKQIMMNGRIQPGPGDQDPFGQLFNDPELPPQFRRFFSQPRGGNNRGDGKRYEVPQAYAGGSGVIFDTAGRILTNNHVVEGADLIKVRLVDRREFTAKLIGTDPHSDLAVIQITGANLASAPLGDSDRLEVGEWVLAMGNPFGLDHTVTAGIVSAVSRGNFAGLSDYQQYIQTDAAINSGNSGGPLVNLDGKVVGINTWIIAPGGGNVGVGFAIPSNMARHIADELIQHGSVERGWLGVQIQELTPDLAETFGLKSVAGALVSNVEDRTPAADAGLKNGDVILSLDGVAVSDVNSLRNRVAAQPIGKTVSLTIWRDKAEKTLTITIGKQPKNALAQLKPENEGNRFNGADAEPTTPSTKKPGDLGVTLGVFDARAAEQLGFAGGENASGALVHDVIPGSPA
ncbi:MAG TPA: Do family serine endopeptidase, partial [Planctomycetota bacterium]|nr:Do family serine endopeptidase [Planctomycetota bacterium]